MTSPDRAFTWVWLPGSLQPVLAGVLRAGPDGRHRFRYAPDYLAQPEAVSLFEPLLPLREGWIDPPGLWAEFSNLRDAAPDSWGRRVLEHRAGPGADNLTELDYMLLSSSNRSGAIDFQESATRYTPRGSSPAIEYLQDAAGAVEEGRPLTPELAAALDSGTSVGGARPKAFVTGSDGVQKLAKFSSVTDVLPVVQAEAAASFLAGKAGVDTPEPSVIQVRGRFVLLTRRFDRHESGDRRLVVSALTLSGRSDTVMDAREGSYPEILDRLRQYGSERDESEQLFRRAAVNIAVSNGDDHLRNHAAFWDGHRVQLTPAYDISPGPRTGESSQAIAYGRKGERSSRMSGLVGVSHDYGISKARARSIAEEVIAAVHDHWTEACDLAQLTQVQRARLWGAQFMHESTLYDWPRTIPTTTGINQPRAPRGIPAGGQFLPRRRADSDPTL